MQGKAIRAYSLSCGPPVVPAWPARSTSWSAMRIRGAIIGFLPASRREGVPIAARGLTDIEGPAHSADPKLAALHRHHAVIPAAPVTSSTTPSPLATLSSTDAIRCR
jgi:hypothetical protein